MNMISVVLEEKDDQVSRIRVLVNGLAPIVSNGRTKYQRLRFAAGTIPTKDWDMRANRPSAAFSKRDGGVLHRAVDTLCLNVQRAYTESTVKTAFAVRLRYDDLLGRRRVQERASTLLLDIVQSWIDKRCMADHTIHTYIGFQRKVADYERRSGIVDLARVNPQDLVDLLRWVQRNYKLAHNSMASIQKLLNKALNEARANGVQTCPKAKLFAYTTPKKEVLDWADLAKILAYQPTTRTEANAQTMLVAIALSSVRISDIWLHLRSIETRSGILCSDFIVSKNASRHPVSVSPIVFEPVRNLLEKNGMPAHVSEIHIRRSIKALLTAVEIRKDPEVHSLRRAFVSLFLSLGLIPDHLLARVFTGHRMMGEKSIFHAYNHASMLVAQKTVIQLLRMVDVKQMSGIQLISEKVCVV